nr:cytochrome c [Deltaproteobacteria bacterium]
MGLCHPCHPGGEAGLGPALNNEPLPDFMIGLQVRHGFGAMPSFLDKRLSDQELEDLLTYLKTLRHHD